MRPPRSALASTGSTAGGAFLRASQVSIAPRMSPPSIGAPKAAIGRDPFGGAEVNVERNVEDRNMRDVDDLGHRGDAQAGKHADAGRERRHAEFARPQTPAHGRQGDQRGTRHEDQPATAFDRSAHDRTYARRGRLCQERRRSAGAPRHRPASAMSSRWIISARPAVPRICAISRELRPRMRSACAAS